MVDLLTNDDKQPQVNVQLKIGKCVKYKFANYKFKIK